MHDCTSQAGLVRVKVKSLANYDFSSSKACFFRLWEYAPQRQAFLLDLPGWDCKGVHPDELA